MTVIRIPKEQRLSKRDDAFQISGIEPWSWAVGVLTGVGAAIGLWGFFYLVVGGGD